VHLCGWLMSVGRFVSVRIDVLHIQAASLTSTESVSFLPSLYPITNLHGVHASLLVCKLMSCFTLLCWDMTGDMYGWLKALLVPIVGVGMALAIWVWDRVLIVGAVHGSWSQHVSNDHDPSSLSPHKQSPLV
jgi:hypothetical protein